MSKIRICLDAGHTGSKYNQSPVVKSYYESRMVWTLHLKLKARLELRGFEVVTTRPSIDTSMDVYARGAAAKGCDVFLSLHSNACDVENVDYPVVYRAYDDRNGADTLALALARMIGQLMGTRQAGRTAIRRNSSGGEAQRLGLARCLAHGAQFMVFDEVAASLDNRNAEEIEKTILSLPEAGVLMITHRVFAENMRRYDRIFVLKDGALVEQGTWEELTGQRGELYRLSLQAGNNEP